MFFVLIFFLLQQGLDKSRNGTFRDPRNGPAKIDVFFFPGIFVEIVKEKQTC